ncbi:MAG TPA: DUF6268 family outer membrane beta-barrel protein [Bacteroidia bacterium]|nr:DUF6268 family outer membrane beta-barrel protein [Bacteroidia bacterium]
MIRAFIPYRRLAFLFWFAILFFSKAYAQPNIDLISINSQHFVSTYADSSKNKMYTQDNFLSIFLPIKFGKGHVFMIRLNAEQLTVNRDASSKLNYSLYSLSMPIGLQLQSKNEKWKFLGTIIPKLNSDFADNLNYDMQIGGIGLVTRVFNPKLQVRLGAYYNSEYWGPFILPLVGVDWKVNDKFRMYGTLPSNYRFEFKLGKKMYTGLGFRSFQRSFRLQAKYDDDFVRIRESQLKVFFEGFVVGKILIGIDLYRTLGYNLIRYDYFDTKTEKSGLPVFTKSKDAYGLTLNLAYRIRTD